MALGVGVRRRRLDLPSLLFRLLLAVGCALPFSTPSALASIVVPSAPDTGTPQEEDEREKESEKEQEEDAKNRTPDRRPGVAPLTARHAVRHHIPPSNHSGRDPAARPTAADPFRNGLGSPYRC